MQLLTTHSPTRQLPEHTCWTHLCIGRLSLQQVPGGNWTSKPDPDWQASWPLEAIWSLCSKLCWGKGLCKKVNWAFRSALPTNSGSVDQGLAQPMVKVTSGVNQ